MPVQHTFQPLPDLRYRLVHTAAQRLLDLLQLRLQSFPHRLPSDLAMALSGGSTTVRKPQKRETLRLPFPPRPALPCGVWSELLQPRLLRMQFQALTFPPGPPTTSGNRPPRRAAPQRWAGGGWLARTHLPPPGTASGEDADFASRSPNSFRNRSASSRCSNPTTR